MLCSGHYVENVGNTTLHYLEIFKTGMTVPASSKKKNIPDSGHSIDRFQDVSLAQVSPTIIINPGANHID